MGTENWDDRLATERGNAAAEVTRQAQAAVDRERRAIQMREAAQGMPGFARWFTEQAATLGLEPVTEVLGDGRRHRLRGRPRVVGWWASADVGEDSDGRRSFTKVFMSEAGALYVREGGWDTSPVIPHGLDLSGRGGCYFTLTVGAIQQALIARLARGEGESPTR